MRLTETAVWRLGPFLTLEENWKVTRIDLVGQDGQFATVNSNWYSALNAAVNPGGEVSIPMAVNPIWRGHAVAVIWDPEDFPGGPTTRPSPPSYLMRTVPTDKQPYEQRVEELSLADWCAIAVQEATDAEVRLRLPSGMQVVLRGDPRQFGPAVVEVLGVNGAVLRRFERQQIPVTALPGETHSGQ